IWSLVCSIALLLIAASSLRPTLSLPRSGLQPTAYSLQPNPYALASSQIAERLAPDRLCAGVGTSAARCGHRRHESPRPRSPKRNFGTHGRRDDALHATTLPTNRADGAKREALSSLERPFPAAGLSREQGALARHDRKHRGGRRRRSVSNDTRQCAAQRDAPSGFGAHVARAADARGNRTRRRGVRFHVGSGVRALRRYERTGRDRALEPAGGDRRNAAVPLLAVGGVDPAHRAARN